LNSCSTPHTGHSSPRQRNKPASEQRHEFHSRRKRGTDGTSAGHCHDSGHRGPAAPTRALCSTAGKK
jgi:hypothetical protein